MAVAARVAIRFQVLGPVRVIVGGVPRPVGGPRRRAVLAVLLLSPRRVVSHERLLEEVWPEGVPATALAALRVHVGGLRKLLGGLLRTEGRGYALDIAPADVDAGRVEAMIAAARGLAPIDQARQADDLRAALALWRGDPFADVDHGPALAAETARLRELRLGALEERIEADLALGRHELLVPELTGLVSVAPLRERLTAQLMLALHRSGRSGEALSVFATLARRLEAELGVDPGDEVTAVERAIRRADRVLLAPAPPDLPVPVSSFVGRARETSEAAGLLRGSRLVTLVGPGGCGKSRLALELARRASAHRPDGVFLVDLSGLGPSGSVAGAVAQAVGAGRHGDEPFEATLVRTLRSRRALLVLDDCDRAGAAAASLGRRLLEACAGMRVLATGRQALGIPGEVLYRLAGLDVPDALQLLRERAGAAGAALPAGPGTVSTIATVCRRLDGLPLAIELVAARLASLSLAEVAARLDHRLGLLVAAGPGPTERHRTMRSAIGWSHDQLTGPERAAFRRLAVFAGTFGADAAEHVVGCDALDPDAGPLALVVRLVDKSMLQAVPGPGDGVRYRMLETLREYAAERLRESGDEAAARDRHAAWYQRLAESSRVYGAADHRASELRLGLEVDNVRAALEWLLGDGGRPDRALAAASPLWWYWWVSGRSDEGRAWLRRCLVAMPASPAPVVAAGLRAAAAMARNAGDYAEARGLGERGLAAARALGDGYGMAASLNGLCMTAAAQGDLDAAVAFGRDSAAWARRIGDPRGIGASLTNLGHSLRALGRLEEAERTLREGLTAMREGSDPRGEAAALSGLAVVAGRRGDLALARSLAVDALATYQRLGLVGGQLDVLETIATLELAAGRPAVALRLLTAAGAGRDAGRLGEPVVPPDRRADRAATLAAARRALEESARAGVAEEARRATTAEVVAEVLHGAPGRGSVSGLGAGQRETPGPSPSDA